MKNYTFQIIISQIYQKYIRQEYPNHIRKYDNLLFNIPTPHFQILRYQTKTFRTCTTYFSETVYLFCERPTIEVTN